MSSTIFSPEPSLVQFKNKVSDKKRPFKLWASVQTEIEINQELKHEVRGGFLKISAILFQSLVLGGLTKALLSLSWNLLGLGKAFSDVWSLSEEC